MNRTVGRDVRLVEIFILLLLVIFTTELAVMEIFAALFAELGTIPGALVDATLLVVLALLPLWLIIAPATGSPSRHSEMSRQTLVRTVAGLAAGCYLVELLVMLVLPLLPYRGHDLLYGALDAGITTLIIAPLLWWLLLRLERTAHRPRLVNLLESPLLLYLLLLYLIFFADLLQALVFVEEPARPHDSSAHIVDATQLTLLVAPFLWLFVARPLRRSVQAERIRGRAVYEQVIDAVVLADAAGRITSVNPAARKMFGYAERELVGRPVSVLFGPERHVVEPLLQAATHGDGRNAGVKGEMTGRHRYGGTLSMDVSVSRILLDGQEDFLLILRDIGERKEAERALHESDIRFREIYEQSEDAILFFKPGSDYLIEANATAERIFGYRREQLRGCCLDLIFPGDDLCRVQQALSRLRDAEKAAFETIAGRRADGSSCIVSLRARLMSVQGVEMLYCTVRDVTERLRMEQEAREIQARLIQANKMTSLGLLVSGVAHEVNNPNNYIMSNAQLLAAAWEDSRKILREYYRENGDFLLGGIAFSEFDDQSAGLIEGIADGSRRINRIIANLKSYARNEPGKDGAEVDVNQVVASSVTILQHELLSHTRRFETRLADGLPPVRGSSQQLGQVVINLLMNACQALPDRDHGISIATGFDGIAGEVFVAVADEGCGIPAESAARIMEPFFTTKLDCGGTGLGLSICRSIIAEHHGVLDFVSSPGQGATFTVKIPAAASAGEDGLG